MIQSESSVFIFLSLLFFLTTSHLEDTDLTFIRKVLGEVLAWSFAGARSYAGLFSESCMYPVCFTSVRFKGNTAIIYSLFLVDAFSYLNKAQLLGV